MVLMSILIMIMMNDRRYDDHDVHDNVGHDHDDHEDQDNNGCHVDHIGHDHDDHDNDDFHNSNDHACLASRPPAGQTLASL